LAFNAENLHAEKSAPPLAITPPAPAFAPAEVATLQNRKSSARFIAASPSHSSPLAAFRKPFFLRQIIESMN
jgi:hypothetical protein